MADHFYPAMMSVIFAGTAPEAALAAIATDHGESGIDDHT